MDEAGQRRPALVADRVGLVIGRGFQFGIVWDELRRDRVGWVAAIDQRHHVGRQRDGEFLRNAAQFLSPFRRDETAVNKVLNLATQSTLRWRTSCAYTNCARTGQNIAV